MNEFYVLIWFIFLRLVSVFVIQTSYVADEYWQSLEVSHFLVYGNGYLTWEWKTGLRSYIYPAFFAFLYRFLKFIQVDNRNVIILLPRLVQSAFTAVGDSYTVRLSECLFGWRAAKWTVFTLSTSWFLFYCGSRTLTNTTEMTLTSIGLFYYYDLLQTKWKNRWSFFRFLVVVAVSIAIRPTSAVQWIPLCFLHLVAKKFDVKTIFTYSAVGFCSLVSMTLVDRLFYGRFVCSLCNFVQFNVINDQGSFYGSHPWHWYWTQGFPVLLGPHLVPFVLEIRRSFKSPFFSLVLWQIFVYSFLSHKEFRFLLPILPISMCFVARYLSANVKNIRIFKLRMRFWSVLILVVINVPLMLYFGLVHQRGTLDVVGFLANEQETHRNVSSISFLMPCHSTPLYSHLHYDIRTSFLSCEPNLEGIENYVDEADSFYSNPEIYLNDKYEKSKEGNFLLPSHLVLFDVLRPSISNFLIRNNYSLRCEFFHSHFIEGRVGKYVQIYTTNSISK